MDKSTTAAMTMTKETSQTIDEQGKLNIIMFNISKTRLNTRYWCKKYLIIELGEWLPLFFQVIFGKWKTGSNVMSSKSPLVDTLEKNKVGVR